MTHDAIVESKPAEQHVENAEVVDTIPGEFKSEEAVVTGKTWIVIGVSSRG